MNTLCVLYLWDGEFCIDLHLLHPPAALMGEDLRRRGDKFTILGGLFNSHTVAVGSVLQLYFGARTRT